VKRKEAARKFLKLCATGKVREAYERFVAPGFRHHNPWFKGDADSLRAGMEEAAAKFPRTTIEFLRTFEDGNLVAVHSRVRHGARERPVAVVHILRFRGERVIELWDLAVPAPEDSPNENGLF
jgi:predicted SnoaL-like aldol condensation-catalyzing enzyme